MSGHCFYSPGSESLLMRKEVLTAWGEWLVVHGEWSEVSLIRKLYRRGSYFQELPHAQLHQLVTPCELDK